MRALNIHDSDFIVECLQALRLESPVYSECADDPDYVKHMLVCNLGDNGQFGVIEESVGFMLGACGRKWYDSRLMAHEQLLYVKPEFRNVQNAVSLIKGFEQLAKERQACMILAGATTGIDNERVLRLYIRLGYEPYLSGVRKRI